MTDLKTQAKFMKEEDLRDKTMFKIFSDFQTSHLQTKSSFAKFRLNALRLGYKYNVSQRVFRMKAGHSKISFLALEEILFSLETKPNQTLFFDCSTFCFEVNPRRAWQNKEKRSTFNANTNYKRYHLLLAVGVHGVFAWQIVLSGVCSGTIASFLHQCSPRLRQSDTRQQVTFVLDNETQHKTDLVKSVCLSEKASFVFTAPHSPYINPIEECFRFLKCKYRNRHSINEYFNKKRNRDRGCESNTKNQIRHFQSIHTGNA